LIRRGEKTEICYGVVFAESVALSAKPEGEAFEKLWPSLLKCTEVRPWGTTEYTVEARGKAGDVVRQSVTVEVR
jgi:hypothetical protein